MNKQKGEVTIQNIIWIAVGVILLGLVTAVVYTHWREIKEKIGCLMDGSC